VIYDARAGRLFKVERMQGAAGWESNRIDISSPPPTFCVDLGSIEVGVVHFAPTGPDFKTVPLGQPMPAAPTKDYKQCFKVKVAGNVLGGVREFSHSAKCVLSALDDLHSRFEAAPEAAQGKIPVVQLSGTTPVVTSGPQGKTTNYAPVFTITGWTDRLPQFGERTVPAPKANGHVGNGASAHVPPPGHVPPPAAAAAPAGNEVPNEMPF
jgi:hypothetical protein